MCSGTGRIVSRQHDVHSHRKRKDEVIGIITYNHASSGCMCRGNYNIGGTNRNLPPPPIVRATSEGGCGGRDTGTISLIHVVPQKGSGGRVPHKVMGMSGISTQRF